MLDKSGIVRRLAVADGQAQTELARWADPAQADPEAFAAGIHRYVLHKFLLDDEPQPPATHELNALAQLSVAKAARLNPNESTLLDVSRHCGATSSFMTKKVLLLMALSRHYGFAWPPVNTADIETTDELAAQIQAKMATLPTDAAAPIGSPWYQKDVVFSIPSAAPEAAAPAPEADPQPQGAPHA